MLQAEDGRQECAGSLWRTSGPTSAPTEIGMKVGEGVTTVVRAGDCILSVMGSHCRELLASFVSRL